MAYGTTANRLMVQHLVRERQEIWLKTPKEKKEEETNRWGEGKSEGIEEIQEKNRKKKCQFQSKQQMFAHTFRFAERNFRCVEGKHDLIQDPGPLRLLDGEKRKREKE